MDFFLWTGLILVLFIRSFKAQDLQSSSLPYSTAALPEDEPSQPKGPPPSPGDGGGGGAPVIAPPSMREVEQAVQEASEQVEGGGAEEVLKGLLERVVEAALGEAGGAAGEQEADAAEGGAGEGEAKAAEGGGGMVEQALAEEEVQEEKGLAESREAPEEGLIRQEQQEEARGESDPQDVEVEMETAAGEGGTGLESEELAGEGGENGAEEPGEVAVAAPPAAPEDAAPVVEPTDILGELEKQVEQILIKAGGEGAPEHGKEGPGGESATQGTERGRGAAEEERHATEEEEAGGGTDTGGAGEPGGGGDIQQHGDVAAKEDGGHAQGWVPVQPPPGGDTAVPDQPIGEQDEEAAAESETDKANGGLAGAEGEAGVGVAAGAGEPGDDAGTTPSVEEAVNHVTGETAETSQPSHTEEQEVLVISEHDAGDKTSADPQQDFLPNPTLIGEATGGDSGDRVDPLLEEANSTNEIPSTDQHLSHGPAVATKPEDDWIDQALATPPETQEAEPGEANGLVEAAAGPSDVGSLGADAWKVGCIAAAVMVILETLLIAIYILKCRAGAKSAPAPGACEAGCVEPETPTGGDCSDDSLPVSNGDTQLIERLDPSDVAVSQHKGKPWQEQQEMAVSDLPPSPAQLVPGSGSAQGSSQDLRTSVV